MNDQTRLRLAWVVAAAALVAGVVLSHRFFADMRDIEERCALTAGHIEKLNRQRDLLGRYESARGVYAAMTQRKPEQLAKLLDGQLFEHRLTAEDARDIEGGWRVRRMRLVCPDAAISEVLKFASDIGDQGPVGSTDGRREQPHWYVAECDIVASAREAGRGELVLVFESLAMED